MTKQIKNISVGLVSAMLLFCGADSPLFAQSIAIDPKTMQRIGSVDERFQSYNIEMVEVTGGRFWKPYRSTDKR